MIKKILKISALLIFFILTLSFFTISLPKTANANTPSIIINDDKYKSGNYEIDDFTDTAIRVSQIILGIVGSLTLLMFTYGGFMFLISSGSPDKVQKAKDILIASVVGLIIVFSSYLIIQFTLSGIGISWKGEQKYTTVKQDTCGTTPDTQGYSCMVPSEGQACISNLCLAQADNVKCCPPAGN